MKTEVRTSGEKPPPSWVLAMVEIVVKYLAIAWSAFQLFVAYKGELPAMEQRGIHLAFTLALVFMLNPLSWARGSNRRWLHFWVNVLPGILGVGVAAYVAIDYYNILYYAGSYTTLQIVMGGIGLLVILEAARRTTGPQLPLVCVAFLLYALFGNLAPETIAHKGNSLESLIGYVFYTTEGIFGIALGVSASFVFLFVLFGAFLDMSGGGMLFIELTSGLVGRVRGGPAKIAVVASALFGSISGSAVANVVATGTFTIPLMKKVGYEPRFAAAVEATASSGGQFTPPIMGAAAFLIAELLGISYAAVIVTAAVPAALYYLALFLAVDLEAARTGLKGLRPEEIPSAWIAHRQRWPMLIPPLFLIILLIVMQYSPQLAAFWSIVSLMAFGALKRESRFTPGKFLECLEKGARGAYVVASACACAGIIVGVIMLTGIGVKLSGILVTLAHGNLLVLLFMTMLAALVLGMGLPVTAVYLVVVVMIAPALIQMGVVPLAAHLFVLYFAIISNVTPPFALAAYAAAGIAKSDPMQTGFNAFRLSIAGFLVPFMFIYGSGLLLIGSPLDIAIAIASATMGCAGLAAASVGFLLLPISWFLRVVLLLASCLMMKQGLLTDVVGLTVMLIVLGNQIYRLNRGNVKFREKDERMIGGGVATP